jgi:phospholipase C
MTSSTRSGTIMDVQHIVILMQENRSFDHYFGTLRGVRGFGDRFPVPVPAPPGQERNVWLQRSDLPGANPALIAPFHLDTRQSFAQMRVAGTPHTWPDAQLAWNHGILDAWPTYKESHAMGFFSEADLPFQFALANIFTICDAYHCSVQAGTNPNRVYAWTGTIDPGQEGHGPVIGNSYDNLGFDPAGGYTWRTYAERLQEAGISWQVYQNLADNYTDNPLAGFKTFRDAVAGLPGSAPALRDRGLSTRTLEQLRADVVAGTLPQVSFIVATADGSEHPQPSSPAQGAHYTATVLEALTASDEVWSKTVLLMMFDENDGWFDHVPPPAPPSYRLWHADAAKAELAGASTVSTAGEYHEFSSGEATESPALRHRPYGLGPRVPLYVISPWSRGGWVNSEVFDHTSVIRFIERRFGVAEPNISAWRRAVCGDLTSAFDFSRPDDSPFMASLPPTQALAERARLEQASVPVPPSVPTLPQQEPGTRPSRALPYALHVHDRVHPDCVELAFANSGSAGAVFHVYDKRNLVAGPRRYTVEAGKELSGRWVSDLDDEYNLWVFGPNGFHRHFRGHLSVTSPTLQVTYGDRSITLALTNTGAAALSCSVDAETYPGTASWRVTVAPGETATRVFSLEKAGNWYDFCVRVDGLPGYLRRLAGRVETGADGVSDPAIGI